ncbi:hypothetical protein CO731_04462 [Aminobacter sp. MSH1]|uniref:SOS response-associated peptidase n=1 Tax=Aminobacter sp. MSH1 TaxID=374606 RepID=UPI000D366DB8|nr:SOS response-associated peptidase family protein [Aminobacter sp. MSH1]AWC24969.1 hypothetical protein CO731_04462 [Aminobacter sp. MSH1]
MCNLYNFSSSQDELRALTKVLDDIAGNLEPSIDVYPGRNGPVVRNFKGRRQLAMLNWGMPTSSRVMFDATKKRVQKLQAKGQTVDFNAMLAKEPDRGVTNIRKTDSKHWAQWLGIENRCVVPFTSFAEPSPTEGDKDPATGQHRNYWFALNESKPLAVFAGFWTPWRGARTIRDGVLDWQVYAFLTASPNAIVAPIHEKAMPVILTTPAEIETWLTAPWTEASKLQRPLPDDMLTIVDLPPTQLVSTEPQGPLI